jgi:hypothetical protein
MRIGGFNVRNWIAITVSGLAMIGTGINAWSAFHNFELNSETQRESLGIAQDTQKTALFSQFQQQYTAVRAGLPARLNDPTFKPLLGTDEYSHLEAYWFFCFSEWYATNKLSPGAYGGLWKNYYSPLIMNALEIPSLRYAAESMILHYPLDRGDYREFFSELAGLTRLAGNPLSAGAEKRLKTPS